VTNANSLTNQALVIDHYYDPEYEFLEVGVNEGGHVTWKVLGPDTDGTYGGQNGTGGFEAIVPGPTLFCPIISDIQGNLLAIYDPKHSGNLNWFPSRETGYGAVPGCRPVPIGQVGPDLGAKYAWRNRAMASIGLVYMGANWYDPTAGQFVSPDSGGHGSSPNLYAFCHGNPWRYWDADGRMGVSTLGAYGSSGRMPFAYRLEMILGMNFSWGEVDNRSFSRRAGEFAVNTVFNVPEITAGLEEVRHPDFSTPLGWLTFGTALIDVGANGVDAASNLIPGKALVEDAIKGGIKGIAKLFVKDAAEDLAKVTARDFEKAAAKTEASLARGWKVGDPINSLTAKGNVPAWDMVRNRFWKNEALNNPGTYSAENLSRMEGGLAPQRINPNTGALESMDLHHTPAQRNGGLFDVQKVWPDEHVAVDPFRHTGN